MAELRVVAEAQSELGEIKREFRRHHTVQRYARFKRSFESLIRDLKAYPTSGSEIRLINIPGVVFRQLICEDIHVVYRYDGVADVVYVHMFIPAKRDFEAHFQRRLLRSPI